MRTASGPAHADEDDYGGGWRRHEWQEHQWREQRWREHEWRERAWHAYQPPVAYMPPGYYVPSPTYYVAPPPAYYAPPPPPVTGSAATLAMGLMLSGCEGTLSDLSVPTQDVYSAPGDYGMPMYSAPGSYVEFGYATPYAYQPGYASPYAYPHRWGEHDRWREHEWRERQEHAFESDGRGYGQHHHGVPSPPAMAAQPRSFAPVAPPAALPVRPPSVATPQADQNRRLLDQLGFRPSR